jgi:hypothetical protein
MKIRMVDRYKNSSFPIIELLKDSVGDGASDTPDPSNCRAYLAFNHLLQVDQLLAWFVYVNDSPLVFQQSPKFLG